MGLGTAPPAVGRGGLGTVESVALSQYLSQTVMVAFPGWLKDSQGMLWIAGAICVAMTVFLPLRTRMKIFKRFSTTCPPVTPLCAVLV